MTPRTTPEQISRLRDVELIREKAELRQALLKIRDISKTAKSLGALDEIHEIADAAICAVDTGAGT